jgi:hypothetical protein
MMTTFLHNPCLVTSLTVLGGYLAIIGYMFWVVAELSESGWWFVFSTLLPYALFSAAGVGGFALPSVGIPVAILAFSLRKRWWQVLSILVVSGAGAFLPRHSLLFPISLAVFVAVHLLFAFLRGREEARSLIIGVVMFFVGSALFELGMTLA